MSDHDYNPKSVDAMFTQILTEQRLFKEAVIAKFDAQEKKFSEFATSVSTVSVEVEALKANERDRRVRYATLGTVFSALGAGIVWVAGKVFSS